MGGKAALRIPIATRNNPISYTNVLDKELISVKCNSIRSSFYNLLRKNQQQIEKEYSVKCTVDRTDRNVSLMIYGKNSDLAMRKSLQLCLDSKVYNFYLCLPVKGNVFEMELDDFKTKYEDKLVGAKWESRPHVTLKMLNIVTNKQLASAINLLSNITKQIQQKYGLMDSVQLDLSALDVFEEREKNPNMAIFAHTKLVNPIDEISQQLIDAVSGKYNFKNDVVKEYKTSDEFQNEGEMAVEDYSLYIHTFDANNDIIAKNYDGVQNTKDKDNGQCDSLQLQNNEDSALPHSPHVTLIRYNNYKDAIGLQGPKSGLVDTCELRPRHGETTWPYEAFAQDTLSFVYSLLHNPQ